MQKSGPQFTILDEGDHGFGRGGMDTFDIELPSEEERQARLSWCQRLRQVHGRRCRSLQLAVVLVIIVLVVVFILASQYGDAEPSNAPPHNGKDTFTAIFLGDWGRHGECFSLVQPSPKNASRCNCGVSCGVSLI